MKIIYVDIDGPMATEGCSDTIIETKWHPALYKMNPECVRIYNEIIQETGAETIISSDWRNAFSLKALGEIFEWNGLIKLPFDITGKECVAMFDLEKNRIAQINASLKIHNPEKWVAFDDLNLGHKSYSDKIENFVLIDPIVGLTGEGIKEKIIGFLN